jgi:hypothetical protein
MEAIVIAPGQLPPPPGAVNVAVCGAGIGLPARSSIPDARTV